MSLHDDLMAAFDPPILRQIRALVPEPPAPGIRYLLVPEGTPHDDALSVECRRLGCNAIVSPAEGRSRLHLRASREGHDVSGPLVFHVHPEEPPCPAAP